MGVGIVGLGMAVNNALPEIIGHPRVKIVAGCDLRQVALDAFAREFSAATYSSLEAMCGDPQVDVVYVFSPDHLHAEHAITALEHGKQVILDKPMGRTLEECEAVVQAAERNSCRVLVGHMQAMGTPFLYMAEMAHSGTLGPPYMINSWFYTDWVYRRRADWETDPRTGGGIVMRQGAIQVDLVRQLGGGLVRSVRASTTVLDKNRPIEGSLVAYLEFTNGCAATLVYNAYGHFDTSELTDGIGLRQLQREPEGYPRGRRLIQSFNTPEEEWAYKETTRYGGSRANRRAFPRQGQSHHPFWSLTLLSCEKGDIRQSPAGVVVYGDEERKEIPIPCEDNYPTYTSHELNEMYHAWSQDEPLMCHDARWGLATAEVCFAIQQSAREHREIALNRQTPYRSVAPLLAVEVQ
jgi:phthalate 4,5-cis-dihydrodiol dehydrogenase